MSGKFKKDYKLAEKKGYNIALLDEVVTMLAKKTPCLKNTKTTL